MYQRYLKRLLDIALSSIGIVLLLPVFLLISIWIKIDSRGPVLFRQKRIGRGKSIFVIYKFRTMKVNTPSDIPTHILQKPDSFITRSGKILRNTSLDELPQIWNILKGDMSIIGPRPALWNQADLLAERDKYDANDIRPGLTGWAQINGRDELEIPVKAALDGEYVKKMSFSFDVRCFIGTILSIFRQEGVVEGGTGTLADIAKEEMEAK
ncbi:MAG TPA: lipid carrier--UDP-N-acetylgalactosaminyltransferase [Clostridiales bacterium]|nr:lipid carrier--UDP-N-acetylgalactosaminyltransferase [Clostridiales bacterium]